MPGDRTSPGGGWLAPAAAGLIVLAAQLALVAAAGTDVPFDDQWDVEGHWLYPAARTGGLAAGGLLRAHNEHRIFWTHLLNLGLFEANGGQWDPLLQLAAGAALHGLAAAVLVAALGRGRTRAVAWLAAAGVTLAFLPLAGWQNALWGFQTPVYFVLLFSILALAGLADDTGSMTRLVAGFGAGVAALLAMGPGAFVPVALLAALGLRILAPGERGSVCWRTAWPALGLLVLAWMLRARVAEHEGLRASSLAQLGAALGRTLAWPHTSQPLAALVLNLPLALAVAGRMTGRRSAAPTENFVTCLGGWAVAAAVGAALLRGGSAEFANGVPSRYADFLVLLPLANAWCALQLATEWRARHRLAVPLAAVWGGFLLAGWVGLAGQIWRGVIDPRRQDRDAPVRLLQAFQRTDDPAVFAGLPRLLVPHPDPGSVRRVLRDPRMAGALPPSLQPAVPPGPLSRAVRPWLGR